MALIKLILVLYHATISPIIHLLAGPGYGCRFDPVCSHYSGEAFSRFGFWRGLILTLKRISRCNPFGPSGYDPVPVVSPIHHKFTLR